MYLVVSNLRESVSAIWDVMYTKYKQIKKSAILILIIVGLFISNELIVVRKNREADTK